MGKFQNYLQRVPFCLYCVIPPYKPDAIDFILQGFDTIVKVFLELAEKLPEQEKPSDYKLLDKALKTIKSLQD